MPRSPTHSKKLPAGWRVLTNTELGDEIDINANRFVARCITEFDKLFGSYTKSDSQVLILENAPTDEVLTRARTILCESRRRNVLNWVNDSATGRVVSLTLYPQQTAA